MRRLTAFDVTMAFDVAKESLLLETSRILEIKGIKIESIQNMHLKLMEFQKGWIEHI